MEGESNISQQAREAAEQAKAGAAEMTERGREAAGKLAAALESARTRVQESTAAGAKATDRAIRQYPYPSLGIAFGLGMLVGVLLGRK